jgi:membrane associated rhomboid family serine protease
MTITKKRYWRRRNVKGKPGEVVTFRLNARMTVIAAIVAVIWAVSISGFVFPWITYDLALVPRQTTQWWGVVTGAFVHSDWAHLLANTAPLTMFLLLLQSKGGQHLYAVVTLSLLLNGALLWCFGRGGNHIGASGLVFALFACNVANAIFARGFIDIVIAVAVVFGYWALIAGVLPTDPSISWDGHLSGLIAGIITSWLLSRWDRRYALNQPVK